MAVQMLDDVVVSFPADYPNSVKHFLMLGFVGMLIGSAIFFYFGCVCYFLIFVSFTSMLTQSRLSRHSAKKWRQICALKRAGSVMRLHYCDCFFHRVSRKTNTMFHVIAFFITCVSAGAYYAMWSGMGVMYKVLKESTTSIRFMRESWSLLHEGQWHQHWKWWH